jgi:activator of HSP90 ATPase
MAETFEISDIIPAMPEKVYGAWLSSKDHSKFTGGKAVIDPRAGGSFTAWDDYISGTTISLEPFTKIVQKWRTTDFPEGSKDSELEIIFQEANGGTKMTFRHTGIPKGLARELKQGWIDYYFTPMKEYFGK